MADQKRKLELLFLNSIQMWGGAEVWLMDVMHGLEQRGHSVSLVCRPNTLLEKNAKAQGFRVFPVKMKGDFDPVTIFQIYEIIKKNRIQVLSTNMDKELRLAGIAAKLAGNVKVVPSREVDYPLKNKLRYRFTYNFLADYVLANSNSTKQTLLKEAPWLDSNRIEVVYKGVDPGPYLENADEGLRFRESLGISKESPVIGFVGQIIERKGIPDIIKSIPLVLEKLPNARFLFAGEGILADFLNSEIKKNGWENSVTNLGFCKEIPALMKALDVLLLPSIVEGFGYVLVEAMLAAKPVVATNVSSIPEIVEDNKTGILIPVHAPQQLADSIVKILSDDKVLKNMGENGKQRALHNFTLKSMLDHIESVFLSITGNCK